MTVTCNTGSQGRRAKTLSRALDADSEAAPVRRAAGERGRRSIAARSERLHHLRLIRTLHPRARACSVRAREDGLFTLPYSELRALRKRRIKKPYQAISAKI